MKIGEVIVGLRKKQGVKQKELASAIGVSATYLSQVEHDAEKPSVIVLSKIAEYFNLPITVLIYQAMALEADNGKEQKRYIKAAEPIINALVNYLLPGDKSNKGKDPLSTVKTNRKKLTF
jgi:transcriptional regulator with XRE-family HTH domain